MKDDFDRRVEEQVARLTDQSFREIERRVASKRTNWLEENRWRIGDGKAWSPRQAYELLFFDYMGLDADQVPVASESPSSLVWRSVNRCPTLEAANRLGLDTRRVCRAAYEKSTQAFLSQLDPQLRFLRSYEEIRPYAGYCKEMIVRIDFEQIMSHAIKEAALSKREGNHGYGALVVMGESVLGQAHDTAVTDRDPSAHAEMNAIRQAARVLGDGDLSGAVLFSTCEPCPMCSSAAVWSNLTTIVYGASIEETARLGKARIRVSANDIVERSPVMIEVIGGVLADECRSLYV